MKIIGTNAATCDHVVLVVVGMDSKGKLGSLSIHCPIVPLSRCPSHLGGMEKRTGGSRETHKEGGIETHKEWGVGDGETHNLWDTQTHRQTGRGSYRGGAHLKISCLFLGLIVRQNFLPVCDRVNVNVCVWDKM